MLTEEDLSSVLNSPLFQTWKVQFQDRIRDKIRDEIRDEILDEIRNEIWDELQELKSNVEENTCKIGEVIPYINETISDTCIEKISKGEFCHT